MCYAINATFLSCRATKHMLVKRERWSLEDRSKELPLPVRLLEIRKFYCLMKQHRLWIQRVKRLDLIYPVLIRLEYLFLNHWIVDIVLWDVLICHRNHHPNKVIICVLHHPNKVVCIQIRLSASLCIFFVAFKMIQSWFYLNRGFQDSITATNAAASS